jgi:hypothetical protein
VPLTTIQMYLGHTSVTTTAKYLEATQQLVVTAVDAVERAFGQGSEPYSRIIRAVGRSGLRCQSESSE